MQNSLHKSAVPGSAAERPASPDWLKVLAVTRTELLLLWRQRAALVGTVSVLAIVALLMPEFQRSLENAPLPGVTPEAAVTTLMFALLPTLLFFALLLYPILLSDALPKDRTWGVKEILSALPLPEGVYLTGKLLAAGITVAGVYGLTLTLIGGMFWAFVGPFDVGRYLAMCLFGVLPVAVLTTLLSVLVAAGQPTRRRALFLGIFFSIACLVLVVFGVATTVTWFDYVNPARPLVLRYTLSQFLAVTPTTATEMNRLGGEVTFGQMLGNVLTGIPQVLLGWLIVRAWLRRQQG